MGDRFLSSAGARGNCARPMRLPDPGPVLDKNRAQMGPEILSSTGAGVWRKAPMAFPDSSSVLDKFQSANETPCPATALPSAFPSLMLPTHAHLWVKAKNRACAVMQHSLKEHEGDTRDDRAKELREPEVGERCDTSGGARAQTWTTAHLERNLQGR